MQRLETHGTVVRWLRSVLRGMVVTSMPSMVKVPVVMSIVRRRVARRVDLPLENPSEQVYS